MNKKIIEIIKQLPNLSKAYLFGSRATGEYSSESDYDVCIVISNQDKEIVYKTIIEYSLENIEFIQPLVLTEKEFKEKMKIKIYQIQIIEKGKLIA